MGIRVSDLQCRQVEPTDGFNGCPITERRTVTETLYKSRSVARHV